MSRQPAASRGLQVGHAGREPAKKLPSSSSAITDGNPHSLPINPQLQMAFILPRSRLLAQLSSSARSFSSSAAVASTSTEPASADASTSAPSTADEPVADAAEGSSEKAPLDAERSSRGGKGFRAWLAADGARFRHGVKGQTNWLGETVSARLTRCRGYRLSGSGS